MTAETNVLWRGVRWSYVLQFDGGGPGLPPIHYPEIEPEEVEDAGEWLGGESRSPAEWLGAANADTDKDFQELVAIIMAEEDKR